jgi:hypothetical protein
MALCAALVNPILMIWSLSVEGSEMAEVKTIIEGNVQPKTGGRE